MASAGPLARSWGVVLSLTAAAGPAHAQTPPQQPSADSATVSDDVTEEGRKIFHGKGTCFACHGQKLQGGPVAPSLLGPKWRNGDGSFEMILHVVRGGVPGTIMVSHPGGITDAQAILVANYVYAVSQKLTKP